MTSTQSGGQDNGERGSQCHSGGNGEIDSQGSQSPDLDGHHDESATYSQQTAGETYNYAGCQQSQQV
jgi:hypothetical protein